MLRWFPRLPVATAFFSCSPPELNFLDSKFIFMYTHYNHCHRSTTHLQLNLLLLLLLLLLLNIMLIKLFPTSTVCAVEEPIHSIHFYSLFVNNTRIMTMIMILMTVIVLEKFRSWINKIYSFTEQIKVSEIFWSSRKIYLPGL
jgi:hypothetical protein